MACIVFVVTLRCCRMSYWSGVRAQQQGWSTRPTADPCSQPHTRGMQGPSSQDCSGSNAWACLDQLKDRATGNKINLFLTAENQETKSSLLGEGDESVQTHGSRPSSCRLLLGQTLLLLYPGCLAPGFSVGRVRLAETFLKEWIWKQWNHINKPTKKPINQTTTTTANTTKQKTTTKERKSKCHWVSSSSAWLRPQDSLVCSSTKSMSCTPASLSLRPLSHTFQTECTERCDWSSCSPWGSQLFATSESLQHLFPLPWL